MSWPDVGFLAALVAELILCRVRFLLKLQDLLSLN